MHHLKKWIVLFTVLSLFIYLPLTTAHASEKTVYDQFQKNTQQDKNPSPTKTTVENPSMGLYVFQFIGSFLLIIGLLIVILKFVSRKTKMLHGGGVFHALGGHSLGNQKSVQMMMIGDTLYILGVGENINVIRTIPPGEEQTKLLESVAAAPIDISTGWMEKWNWDRLLGWIKRTTKQEKWDSQFLEQLKKIQSKKNNQDRS